MEDKYILRYEHKEFAKRQDEENTRQNRRIAELEDNVKQINALTISVEKMATNMENMLSAIERQGNLIERQSERLEKIEDEPAEDYKQLKANIAASLISAIIGAIVTAVAAMIMIQ